MRDEANIRALLDASQDAMNALADVDGPPGTGYDGMAMQVRLLKWVLNDYA